MFCSRTNSISSFAEKKIASLFCMLSLFTFVFAGHLGAQVVASYSFEDGTADGWSSFNGATAPVATNAIAHGGSFSLLTTTGSTGHGGPSIPMTGTLLAGAQYTITGFIQLTAGETAGECQLSRSRGTIRVVRVGRASIRSARSKFRWVVRDGRRLAGTIR